MKREKGDIISDIIDRLACDDKLSAKSILLKEYPHKVYDIEKRTYTVNEFLHILRKTRKASI